MRICLLLLPFDEDFEAGDDLTKLDTFEVFAPCSDDPFPHASFVRGDFFGDFDFDFERFGESTTLSTASPNLLPLLSFILTRFLSH